MKYFLTLLICLLTLQSAYSLEYPERPKHNQYSPSKQVIARKDFLTGKYIRFKDPVVARVLEYETGMSTKNTNKYLLMPALYSYKVHAAYAYRYNQIDAWFKYSPPTQDGSETEDVR